MDNTLKLEMDGNDKLIVNKVFYSNNYEINNVYNDFCQSKSILHSCGQTSSVCKSKSNNNALEKKKLFTNWNRNW